MANYIASPSLSRFGESHTEMMMRRMDETQHMVSEYSAGLSRVMDRVNQVPILEDELKNLVSKIKEIEAIMNPKDKAVIDVIWGFDSCEKECNKRARLLLL